MADYQQALQSLDQLTRFLRDVNVAANALRGIGQVQNHIDELEKARQKLIEDNIAAASDRDTAKSEANAVRVQSAQLDSVARAAAVSIVHGAEDAANTIISTAQSRAASIESDAQARAVNAKTKADADVAAARGERDALIAQGVDLAVEIDAAKKELADLQAKIDEARKAAAAIIGGAA